MKFIPHDYQKFTISKIIEWPKIIEILDMGLGKTVCTLTALNDLMYERFEVEKVLVIAPLRVAETTWVDEIEKWDHLDSIRWSKILGSEQRRIKCLKKDADIYLINRENTKWLIQYCVQVLKKWPFDVLVVDESSSFKNPNSQRFKALRKVAPLCKRVILLTGTPTPNSLIDLWPQIYLLDQGERLGKTLTSFRQSYFNPGKRNRNVIFTYVPKPGADKIIYKKIEDVAVSLKAVDHLKMPERVDNIIKLKMTDKVKKLYKEMEEEYILEIADQEITAATAAVVVNKLLQMANGAVYAEDKSVIELHDIKLDALEEFIEDNEGKPIIVFYNYKHDLERLRERFNKYQPRTLDKSEDIKDWNEGKIQLLFAHPASMGHGLNLQAGGSIIVWFSLTWSLELYQQANARLYRQGQKDVVVVNHLVMEGTQDEVAMQRLESKRQGQDDLIEAVKALIDKYQERRK